MNEPTIPMVDLQAQYRALKPDVDAAVARVFDSAQFVLGPAVADFESRFAAYCRTGRAVGTSSGTAALHLALVAAGVGPGDDVITVPYTFVASVAAIEYAGARPVLVDVEPGYWTMDPARLAAAITPRTKAILPVHLYGQPADMDPILEVSRAHGIPVIEDACQSHGADYKGRRCGSMGLLGCFSFYPGKNLGAYGEGGAVTTSDAALDAHLRSLRAWGEEVRYQHKYRGFNYRMDGVQGAVLGVKLGHLDAWTAARQERAAWYRAELAGADGVELPPERPGCTHVYHQFVVRVPARDAVRAALAEAGVQTGVHYPIPVHLQEAYRDLGYTAGDFPVAEGVAGQVLSLPMYPELTAAQVRRVASTLRRAVAAGAAR